MTRWQRWRAWTRAHPLFFDTCLALLLLAGALASMGPGRDGSDHPTPAPTALSYALVLLAAALVVVRRLRPVPVLVGVLLATLGGIRVDDGDTQTVVFLLVAVYTVSMLRPWRTALPLTVVSGVTVFGALWAFGADTLGQEGAYAVCALLTAAFAFGVARRARRQVLLDAEERAVRAEQSREEEARRRVTEERLRIARELHDVLAHHISVINVQSGVAQHLLATDPERAGEAIGHVREASKVALSEMSTVLGLLRTPEEEHDVQPAPGLAQADALVDSVRRSGLPVTWRVTGTPRPLAPVTDLAAYRVVQESLTNAGKHGSGAAEVHVDYRDDSVVLDVGNRMSAVNGTAGAGLGLLGMRERVASVGGTLEAGPRDGRFLVHVVLPAPRAVDGGAS